MKPSDLPLTIATRYWTNGFQTAYLVMEAQAVMSMRMMGMAGVWSVSPSEDARMVSEKVYALTKAQTDAAKAAMQGQTPDQIAAAAIKPIRQKTRANARRLQKRGMKGN